MAEIIDARVKQKTGVAADFAGFTLLEGEFALVRSSSDGPVINYKVGPGLFDSLPWSLQVPGTVASVGPSTDFDALPAGLYLPDSDGTYDGTVAVDLTEGVTYLNWDGTTLTKQLYPINLAGYTTVNTFNEVAAPTFDIANRRDSYPFSDGTWANTTSTFSGWATPIGIASNISVIMFRTRARATPITSIYWELRESNHAGTLLASGTESVSIAANTAADVLVDIGSVITGGTELYFGYKCNQFCDMWGTNAGDRPYPDPPYSRAYYAVNGSQDPGWVSMASTQVNFPVATGTSAVEVMAPTDTFMQQIENRLPQPVESAEIVLASRVYAVVGTETNVYFKDIIYTTLPLESLDIDVTSTRGKQYDDRWSFIPVTGEQGTASLTISVSYNGTLLATATATVYTAAANAGTGLSRSVIVIGDSTTAGGQVVGIITTDHGADVMSVTFKGTQGTAPNNHEGRGGWRIVDYATAGRTFFKFNLTGVINAPSLGATYTNNSSTFAVREVNIGSGTGYISCERTSGSNNPQTSGTLTKASGSGDSALTYTSYELVAGNPFWDDVTSQLNFSAYLTDNSISMVAGDWFVIHLGINDIFGYTTDAAIAPIIVERIGQLRQIISAIHAAVTGIRVGICITIPPSISQTGFGDDYGVGQTLHRYFRNLKLWQQAMIAEFDNGTDRAAGNHVIPFNAVLDRENNFPFIMADANARSTEQVRFYNNGVHPADSGYYQMGDQLWAFLKYMA